MTRSIAAWTLLLAGVGLASTEQPTTRPAAAPSTADSPLVFRSYDITMTPVERVA